MLELLAGFAAGAVHVWSGPDHLGAIAPLALRGRRRSWLLGVRWGIGHSAGVALVALIALAARGLVSTDVVSAWGERIVGLTLVAIGLWGLRTALSTRVHEHRHAHDGHEHVHLHAHAHPHGAQPSIFAARAPHVHTHAAMGIGVLHGLAGSSHFLGVLPALAFPTLPQAIAYVAGFGGGTIVAMACFGALVDWLGRRFAWGGERAYRALMAAFASAALGLGGFWLATA
jgi:ABC-type nickel/cobalt efflux system permease component RcnA